MRNIYEVFQEFENAPTKTDKKNVLLKNDSWALRCVLRGTYHPGVKYAIKQYPYYKPPTETPVGMSYSNITQELRRVYIFEEGNPRTPAGLTDERRIQILTQILENLEARESIVFMNMLLKKQQAKGLTENLIKEVFPDLLT